jgi:hypothetical protein
MNQNDPLPEPPEKLRPLKWNERVESGDFVEDGRGGFEPWDGPRGFRADSFIKQIYRRLDAARGARKECP